MYLSYVSENNSNREKQVILLIIPNGEARERSETLARRVKCEGRKAKSKGQQRWHYLAVKKLSVLLRGTTKHHSYFYRLHCLHSFATTKKLNRIKKYVKIKIFATL